MSVLCRSPTCFELGWPMRKESSFLQKPKGSKRVRNFEFDNFSYVLELALLSFPVVNSQVEKTDMEHIVHSIYTIY